MIEAVSSNGRHEKGFNDEMNSQKLRENLLLISRTPDQFHQATKLAHNAIYEELEIIVGSSWKSELPQHTAHNRAITVLLPPVIQEQILSKTQVPFTDEIPYLRREGWRTLSEIGIEINAPESNVRLFVNQINPEWINEVRRIPMGQRRGFLLPPILISNIKRYAGLSVDRELLANWRSVRLRNESHFKIPAESNPELMVIGQFFSKFLAIEQDDSIFNIFNFNEYLDLVSEKDEKLYMRAINRGNHATVILENKNLLNLNEEDRSMVKNFQRQGRQAIATLILSYMPLIYEIANRSFHKIKKRRMKDIIAPQDLQEESVKALFYSISNYPQSQYRGSLREYILSNTQPWIQRYVHELAEEYGDAQTPQRWAKVEI